MKKFEKYERRGLPGGPNEITSYMTGAISTQGYKSDSPDKYNDFNIIASNNITMKGVDFPVFGMDNLGNMAAMMPGADYKFPGDMVFEMPMAQKGGDIPMLDPNRSISSQADEYTEPSERDRIAVRGAINDANSFPTPDLGTVLREIQSGLLFTQREEDQREFDKALNFAANYMSSPRYREMLSNSGGTRDYHNEYDIAKARINNLNSLQEDVKYSQDTYLAKLGLINPDNSGGLYHPSSNNIYVNKNTIGNQPSVFDHELSHLIDFMGVTIPDKDADLINSLVDDTIPIEYIPDFIKSSPLSLFGRERAYRNYLTSPTETRARLNEIRRRLYDKGVDIFNNKVTPEDYDKLHPNEQPIWELRQVFPNESILKMLNEISMDDSQKAGLPMGQYGGGFTEDGIPMLDPSRPISSQTGAYTPPSEADNIAAQDAMNQANAQRADDRAKLEYLEKLDDEAQALGFRNYTEYSQAKARENTMGVDNTFTTQASDMGMYNTYLPEITIQSDPRKPTVLGSEALGSLFPAGGAEAIPIVGDAMDGIMFADAVKKGNYLDALIYAGAFALPIIGATGLRQLFRRGRSSIKPNKSFKSEIDWGKWNEEIPLNKELMQEYHTIEEVAKAKGTWMKNPDGSPFQGPQELFVQTQSNNFLKAFPDGYTPTYRGMDTQGYSDELIAPRNKGHFTGVFTASKNIASDYGKPYSLAARKSDNSLTIDGFNTNWDDLRIFKSKPALEKNLEYQKKLLDNYEDIFGTAPGLNHQESLINIQNRINDYELLLKNWDESNVQFNGLVEYMNSGNFPRGFATDDLASYLEKAGLDNVSVKNIYDMELGDVLINNQVPGNYLKSLDSNNGIFDMTNPNIYKQEGGELEQRAIAMGESPEYARAVQNMIDNGATIQELASRRIGTVSGLSQLFPDAEMGTAPQRSSSSSSSSSGGGANSEDNSRYYNRALKFFSEGKTIDDLVNMRYGTREGLTRMFPDAPISSSATYSPSPENKPSPMPQQTPAQVSSGPTEIPAQPAMITPEPIIQRKDVDAGLAADAQMAREQMRSGSLSTQPNITYENYLPETIIYGEKEEPLGYNSISSPSLSGQFNFGSGLNKFLPIPAASTEPFFTVPQGTFRGPSSIEEINQRRAEQEEVGKGILQNEYTSSGVDKYTNISFDEYPSYLTEDMEGYDQVINEADQDVSQSTNTNSPYADKITETEINRRLAYDIPRYGEFMNNPRVVNRTGNLRQNDANIFFADVVKPNSVIIDIGAGLGNSNPREAGISTYELFKNPKIQENNITVIASDIAPEAEKFITRENNPHGDMEAYSIPINEQDWSDINNYMTPIADILKEKGVSDTEDIYLRATNGIDILMDEDVTEKHFEHLGNTLTDKNLTYVFNNTILYKPKGEKQFTKIGNISNTGMDHRNPSWIGKDFDPTRSSHYLLNDDLFGDGYVPKRRFGGRIDDDGKTKYVGETDQGGYRVGVDVDRGNRQRSKSFSLEPSGDSSYSRSVTTPKGSRSKSIDIVDGEATKTITRTRNGETTERTKTLSDRKADRLSKRYARKVNKVFTDPFPEVPNPNEGKFTIEYEQGGEAAAPDFGSYGLNIEDTLLFPRYINYMNGNDESIEARRVYDKLNRKVYRYAKQGGMTAPDYMMTEVLRLGGSV